jgi:hypothetical protein
MHTVKNQHSVVLESLKCDIKQFHSNIKSEGFILSQAPKFELQSDLLDQPLALKGYLLAVLLKNKDSRFFEP